MGLFRWVFHGGGGGGPYNRAQHPQQQPVGGIRQPGGQQQRRPQKATLDQVAEALQKLPVELFATKAELEGMRVYQLKVWMRLWCTAWGLYALIHRCVSKGCIHELLHTRGLGRGAINPAHCIP